MGNWISILPILLFIQTTEPQQNEWERIRSIAETQHEIVMLLIKNQEFDKVLEASKKIFSLEFPAEQEHLLVKEGQILCDALVRHKQYDLAHRVLDEALKATNSSKSKAVLFKEKAYVCTKEGKDERAMQLFERALELEESGR